MTARLRRCLAVGFLAAIAWSVGVPRASAEATRVADRGVVVILVPGMSFERLLGVPEVRALARAGGAALMSSRTPLDRLLRGSFPDAPVEHVPGQVSGLPLVVYDRAEGDVEHLGSDIREAVGISGPDVLVIVASPSASPAMRAAKDELAPIVVAVGRADLLFPSSGPMRALASDTTRRTGVVSDEDVVPTILDFLRRPIPDRLTGSVLRVVDATPPFDLHARHIANRRIAIPIQVAAALYVTGMGLLGVIVIALRRKVPGWVESVVRGGAMSVLPLATALLLAGHLLTLSYATVVPFVVGVTAVCAVAALALRRFGLWVPPAAQGIAVLAFFAVEAALGWRAAQTPFLGGSELDGGRFFGMPNAFIGLVMGAAVYAVVRLQPTVGASIIGAAGLFVGLPGAGANIGGSVALFAAAGLWFSIRTRGKLDWRAAAAAAAGAAAGAAAVLLAHRFLTATPTHGTRFVEESARSLTGLWGTFVDRLGVGFRLIALNPFALVPVVGLPIVLVVALRPPHTCRAAFQRNPEWRHVVLVLSLGGIVAYLVNDSGPAAGGQAFATSVAALVWVSLARPPEPGAAEPEPSAVEPSELEPA